MKYLLLILILNLFTFSIQAQEEFSYFGTLHKQDGKWYLRRSAQKDVDLNMEEFHRKHPTHVQMGEALVKGEVHLESISVDGKTSFRPVLVVSSMRPISLKEIGVNKSMTDSIENYPAHFNLEPLPGPLSFPVSTEIASSITLTTTVLLMQSLTAGPETPLAKQQMNTGLVLMAGSMATLMFIYDQIQGKK